MLPVALAILALATGQDPGAARPTVGRVLDGDGKPVAGATVSLLSRPIPACLEAGPELRVTVATDAKGMFRAELQPLRTYSAWAAWHDGATAIEEGVEAGAFVTLTRDPMAARLRLHIEGMAAWAARGPFVVRALVGGENVDFVTVPVQDDDTAEIPPLPFFEFRQVEILGSDGEVLWSDVPRAGPDHARDGALVFTIPPPFRTDLVVRDEAGKPIAGASVRRHIRNYWVTPSPAVTFADRFRALWPLVGTTDAEGRLRVRVPAELRANGVPERIWLLAHADGHRATTSGWHTGVPFRNGKQVEGDPGELVIRLERVEPITRRVLLAPDAPLGQGPVMLGWRIFVRGEGATGTPMLETASVVDGVLRAPLAPPAGTVPADRVLEWIALVMPHAHRAALTKALGCAPPLAVRLRGRTFTGDIDTALLAQELRLVEVVTADGRPAERVVVTVSPPDERPEDSSNWSARTDRLGRALIARGGQDVLAFSADARGLAVMDADDTPLRIALRPLATALVRVVDAEGRPAAGAVVRSTGFVPVGNGPLEARETMLLARSSTSYAADADGRLRLPCPPVAGTLHLAVCDPTRPKLDCGKGSIVCPVDAATGEVVLQYAPPR